jgi:integrase
VQLFRELVQERTLQARPLRLVEFVAVYATTRAIEPATARQYRITAERLEQWAGESVLVTDLTELMISAFLRDYGQAAKPATVRSKRCQIMALWRAAADEYLCEPPTRRVRSTPIPWEPRDCFTLLEVEQLVAATAGLRRGPGGGMHRREWWDLAIRVAWDSGLRWGDQVRLRPGDIHGDTVVVCQRKTRRPYCGRLRPSTVAMLADSLRRCPREYVTPWPASHETFRRQFRGLVAKAGVRPGTWRWLRRGGATDVELQEPGRGMAARHLGHAPGSRIAELHYINPAVVAASVPVVAPREIGAATRA